MQSRAFFTYIHERMRLPDNSDLTVDEMLLLRRIVAESFVTLGSVSKVHVKKLVDLGLVTKGMGGLMPSPAGKIMARR